MDLLGINTKQEKTEPRNQHQTIKGEGPTINFTTQANCKQYYSTEPYVLQIEFQPYYLDKGRNISNQ